MSGGCYNAILSTKDVWFGFQLRSAVVVTNYVKCWNALNIYIMRIQQATECAYISFSSLKNDAHLSRTSLKLRLDKDLILHPDVSTNASSFFKSNLFIYTFKFQKIYVHSNDTLINFHWIFFVSEMRRKYFVWNIVNTVWTSTLETLFKASILYTKMI